MVDHLPKEQRSWNMSRIGCKNTGPEQRVRSMLHNLGYRFRLHRKDMCGNPDIVLPKYRTVIFVHGCFWHRHVDCKYATTPSTNRVFWLQKFQRNVERDHEVRTALEQDSWRVLIVWECELRNPEKLRERLDLELSGRLIAEHQMYMKQQFAAEDPGQYT